MAGLTIYISRTTRAAQQEALEESLRAEVRVLVEGAQSAVARVALPLSQVEANIAQLQNAFVTAAIITAAAAIGVAILIAGRTSRSINRLTEVARRLETVRHDFISNISHELRTPLASLKALVETLRDGAVNDPPTAQRFLERADYEVDVLTQMVVEFLELTRIESGTVPLLLQATSVEDVVVPPVERLRPQAERDDIRLTLDLAADLPSVLSDSDRVQQVVSNLVHNAIKFTPAGGKITVSAAQDANDPVVIFSVKDTGVGIPANELP